jgi:hypothetical protein
MIAVFRLKVLVYLAIGQRSQTGNPRWETYQVRHILRCRTVFASELSRPRAPKTLLPRYMKDCFRERNILPTTANYINYARGPDRGTMDYVERTRVRSCWGQSTPLFKDLMDLESHKRLSTRTADLRGGLTFRVDFSLHCLRKPKGPVWGSNKYSFWLMLNRRGLAARTLSTTLRTAI